MEDVSDYKFVCPVCHTDSSVRIIMKKENKKRYYCRECGREIEVSKNKITLYIVLKDGHAYKEREIKK